MTFLGGHLCWKSVLLGVKMCKRADLSSCRWENDVVYKWIWTRFMKPIVYDGENWGLFVAEPCTKHKCTQVGLIQSLWLKWLTCGQTLKVWRRTKGPQLARKRATVKMDRKCVVLVTVKPSASTAVLSGAFIELTQHDFLQLWKLIWFTNSKVYCFQDQYFVQQSAGASKIFAVLKHSGVDAAFYFIYIF